MDLDHALKQSPTTCTGTSAACSRIAVTMAFSGFTPTAITTVSPLMKVSSPSLMTLTPRGVMLSALECG